MSAVAPSGFSKGNKNRGDGSLYESCLRTILRSMRGETFAMFILVLCVFVLASLHGIFSLHQQTTDTWYYAHPPVAGWAAGRAMEALDLVERIYGPHNGTLEDLFFEHMYGTHTGHVVERWFHTGNWSDRRAVEEEGVDTLVEHMDDHKKLIKEDGSDAGQVYGEILSWSLVEMLVTPAFNLGPDKKCYDLGSGHARAAMLAGLLGLNVVGIEFEKHRHDYGCKMIQELNDTLSTPTGHGSVTLLQTSFRTYDFSDADFAFANSVTWTDQMMEDIARTAAQMKVGSTIIISEMKGHFFDEDPRFRFMGRMPLAGSWIRPHAPLEQWPGYRAYRLVKPNSTVPNYSPRGKSIVMNSCGVRL
eukprot:gnl/MRDRNA2_/MRDRNA2_131570_c0_seq1.p1 gnl/MRDRNA2_/MRDRNA2_131570_c0~~gnl/MRDRNA2_/MRDRNA2_131570_c0_seq1.p1  ORF type:complete len:360 (-),score=55.85 gnl/MRDRNA2_/MRDRNA2_131570_c0_seq1:248-1327(-)